MRAIIRWTLLAIGLVVLGFAFYLAKLNHDLGVSINGDINRRLATAGAQVQVLDGANESIKTVSKHDLGLIGQAAVSEFLMSFQIVSWFNRHGTIPASIEEIDRNGTPGQPSSKDPWGNAFEIVPEGTDRYLIVSGGPSATPVLTAEERDALRKQPVGRTYQLRGKIIFMGGVLTPIGENQQKSTATHSN
jgi:hypothetical protein